MSREPANHDLNQIINDSRSVVPIWIKLLTIRAP